MNMEDTIKKIESEDSNDIVNKIKEGLNLKCIILGRKKSFDVHGKNAELKSLSTEIICCTLNNEVFSIPEDIAIMEWKNVNLYSYYEISYNELKGLFKLECLNENYSIGFVDEYRKNQYNRKIINFEKEKILLEVDFVKEITNIIDINIGIFFLGGIFTVFLTEIYRVIAVTLISLIFFLIFPIIILRKISKFKNKIIEK